MADLEDNIQQVKEAITQAFPKPPGLKEKSSANALKDRLDWGEPVLTTIDVRDREAFNCERITGAMSMPLDELVEQAQDSLEPVRDIYVYGETNQETTEAASRLREAGFRNVAELEGGLPGWKAISGSTEGQAFNAAFSDQ
ncbi:MAG: rhodanese-like domain-containing protein [Hydrococcus sp. C42_A2020_068]|nr:rhodanese-like domain-containing protein [Hydrococcus sp. C42_A2020_068]